MLIGYSGNGQRGSDGGGQGDVSEEVLRTARLSRLNKIHSENRIDDKDHISEG